MASTSFPSPAAAALPTTLPPLPTPPPTPCCRRQCRVAAATTMLPPLFPTRCRCRQSCASAKLPPSLPSSPPPPPIAAPYPSKEFSPTSRLIKITASSTAASHVIPSSTAKWIIMQKRKYGKRLQIQSHPPGNSHSSQFVPSWAITSSHQTREKS